MSDDDRQGEQKPLATEPRCGTPWGKPELTYLRAGDARTGGSVSVDGVTLTS